MLDTVEPTTEVATRRGGRVVAALAALAMVLTLVVATPQPAEARTTHDCGYWTCTIYYDKATTKTIADAGSWSIGIAVAQCQYAGVYWWVCSGAAAAAGAFWWTAKSAVNQGRCLAIRYTNPSRVRGTTFSQVVVAWPTTHGGWRCH